MSFKNRKIFLGDEGWHNIYTIPTPEVISIFPDGIFDSIKYCIAIPALNLDGHGYNTIALLVNINSPINGNKVYITYNLKDFKTSKLFFDTWDEAEDCLNKQILPLLDEENYIEEMKSFYDRDL